MAKNNSTQRPQVFRSGATEYEVHDGGQPHDAQFFREAGLPKRRIEQVTSAESIALPKQRPIQRRRRASSAAAQLTLEVGRG